ncbi:glycoside hydrolase [Leifsonia sp. YIM 134122]|uniref:Glycoside hydrolase n=1 Tax=Leifsonia stereocauli TaxID=3134136 RepID=A0ABU9W696_9MICO
MKSIRTGWAAALTTAVVLATSVTAAAVGGTPSQAASIPVTITPNPASPSAAFDGWGTSLVWFANATGGYPDSVRQELFDKVFGEDGLNLNIARYNIGGGNATDVPSYLRPGGAVDGWWNPDLDASDANGRITSTYADRSRYAAAWDGDDASDYDFTADATQLWWVNALKDKITKWEAFSNSPPYFLTQSGYASGGIGNGNTEQLAPANMDKFATYLTTVVEHIESTYGVDFDTLDPFNEPNTNYWSTTLGSNGWPTSASRQEGAHIGPAAQDQMIKVLAAKLAAADTTTDVKISAMDETNPSIFATNWNAWSQQSKDLVSQLNVHTYGTSDRLVARDIAKASGKPLWMSEVEGDWDGTGFNQTNIENGIGVATRMIDDMRELEPSAWVFWQPVEDLYNMQKVEKLNWGSVFVDFDCNAQGQSLRRIADGSADPSCKVLTNAKYNTVRNFTHYIRPGDNFIPTNNTQTTAALTADGAGLNLVHVNSDSSARDITLDLSGFGTIAAGATVTPVVTTASPADDVEKNALVTGAPVAIDAASKTAHITVPAKSVTTLVVSGASGVAETATRVEDGHGYQLIGTQSGKALTAPAQTGAGGVTITTTATTAQQAGTQLWTAKVVSGAGTNRERIVLSNGVGRVLGSTASGTVLVDATPEQAAADKALQWIPSTTNGTTFGLVSAAYARALDVNGQATADGTVVGTWPSNNGSNQLWSLKDTQIVSVNPTTASTIAGVAPTLPSTVTVTYRGGVQRSAAVTWDVGDADWSKPGSVTLSGSGTDLFGAAFDSAEVVVDIGGFASTDPVSVTTYAGASAASVRAAAPTSVPAQIGASDNRYAAAVTWDWSGLTDAALAAPGVLTIPGSAASNDASAPALPATLSVIVTAPGEKNIAPASTAAATFTESASYSVDRTKNGVTNDKGWSNWRSANKNAQDTLTYNLAAASTVNHVTVRFYKDSTTSWAKTMRVEYQAPGSSAWTSAGTVDVPIPADGTAPVVDVSLGGVQAKQVRVVMDAYANTHMIVSEVEIYARTASAAGVTDLARLSVDGAALPGFSGSTTDYSLEVEGDRWPRVTGVAVDSNATIAITQADENAGTATLVVTAPDGASRTYSVVVTRSVAVTAPHIEGAALLGETLTAVGATADPAGATLAYRWNRNGTAIGSATGADYRVGEADIDKAITVTVTASAPGFEDGVAVSEPVVPSEVPAGDGSTSKPAVGVLASDNGWDTGLLDGSYRITMNLWWGTNATLFKLYENGSLIKTVRLTSATPAAQQAVVDVADRKNGTYVYTGALVNGSGTTKTQSVAVVVKDANPSTPVLSHDNHDKDGRYTLTANLWWGTNATSYTFYENGTAIGSGELKAGTPAAQKAALAVTGKAKGTYSYTVAFTNAAGTTTSLPVSVTVSK